MNREKFVLAVLSTADGASVTPLQIQKLLFILERELPKKQIKGRAFSFKPYHYGPFDREVYDVLGSLMHQDLVSRVGSATEPYRTYRTTSLGQSKGEELFETLDELVQVYARQVSEFVRSLSFSQLVSAIYKEYPEMKKNSVFER